MTKVARATSGFGNLSCVCLHMCGQRRPPPPQPNVHSKSLQVMPVLIKIKHLSRCRETNLSCRSYYSRIKLSCLGPRGCKNGEVGQKRSGACQKLLRHHTQVCNCVCVKSVLSQNSMWRHSDGNLLQLCVDLKVSLLFCILCKILS